MFITQFRTFFKLFIFLLGIVLPIYGKAWPVSSGKFAVVHAFEATNSPSSFSGPKSLIKARDGNIYGVTGGDILDNSGIIFKLDLWQQPAAYSDYFKFADFDNVTEDLPFIHPRHLFQTRDGSFYVSGLGPGAFAGPEYLYQVSSLSPPKASLISTYPTWMSDATGSHRLVQSKDGKFYTTTTGGGDYIASQPYLRSAGTIVEIDPENKDEFNQAKILHIFDGYNGANPLGGLIRIKDSFYGTACQTAKDNNGTVTAEENGVIFRYDLTGKYTVLHRFKGADGACPEGELLRARNGKLYGVTSAGGKANLGVIFELDIKFPVPLYRVLHNFDGIQGSHPRETLVQSPRGGRIYGVTFDGGSSNKGVVFQLDVMRQMTRYSVLYQFDGTASGENPGNLVIGRDCKLYGTANGGPKNGGLIFSIGLKPVWYWHWYCHFHK